MAMCVPLMGERIWPSLRVTPGCPPPDALPPTLAAPASHELYWRLPLAQLLSARRCPAHRHPTAIGPHQSPHSALPLELLPSQGKLPFPPTLLRRARHCPMHCHWPLPIGRPDLPFLLTPLATLPPPDPVSCPLMVAPLPSPLVRSFNLVSHLILHVGRICSSVKMCMMIFNLVNHF